MAEAAAAGARGRWAWLKSRSPLLAILVTPVATAPLALLLLWTLGGEHEAVELGLPAGELCRFEGHIAQECFYYFDLWRTWLLFAIPGVLNLAAALWFLDRNGYVRVAAGVALVLGLLRSLLVPIATAVIAQFEVINDGGLWLRVEVAATGLTPDINSPSEWVALRRLLVAAWIGGGIAWALTLILWRTFDQLMARFWRDLDPPSGPRPDEPRRWTGFLRRP